MVAERFALRYARIALGVAFLAQIVSRVRDWPRFEAYCAAVNSFMPAWSIPVIARVATVLELAFGIALVLGVAVRRAAIGAAVLLCLFAIAMAISFGIQEPLDYSVWSASACALLVAVTARSGTRPGRSALAM